MKTKIFLAVVLISVSSVFVSCKKANNDEPSNNSSILPSKFKVDIPNSICRNISTRKSARTADSDTIQGNEVYKNLTTFIFVGESCGDMVEAIIKAIGIYQINKPMRLSFLSNDDNRTKNLIVKENQSYNGTNYEFMLLISDALSESEADGGKAMQVFWNTKPVSGVAILKPFNCNRINDQNSPNALYQIEYSELSDANYDSHMLVEIDGLTMPDPVKEPYAISTLKMFVGKKGNRVDVYGNSEHPNAKFFNMGSGFDWAFVASGFDTKNIGVAEVGLPGINVNDNSRKVLLEDNSIKNVFTRAINDYFIGKVGFKPDSASLSGLLKNADAPGFFSNNGFIQAGVSPDSNYDELTSQIKLLTPYNPKEISELTINFK